MTHSHASVSVPSFISHEVKISPESQALSEIRHPHWYNQSSVDIYHHYVVYQHHAKKLTTTCCPNLSITGHRFSHNFLYSSM